MTVVGVVRMGSGDWLLARTDMAVLYASPAAGRLVDAFLAAGTGAIEAVTEAFDAGSVPADDAAFTIVDWHAAVRVVVHGDVTLVSDHPSLPRLSASGVGTWVERPVRASGETLTLGVEPDRADAATDLLGGVVRAGSFAIEIMTSTRSASPSAPVSGTGTDVTSTMPVGATSRPSHRSPAAALAAAAGGETLDPVARPESRPDPVADPIDDTPASEPAHGSSPSEPVDAPDEPPGGGPITDLPPAPPRGSASLPPPPGRIEAIVCPTCGAPNRADAADCRRCGATWPPDTPTATVARPRWRLVFDDAPDIVVDHPIVIGREPDEAIEHWPADATAVVIDSAFLSGEHLEIRPVDWELQITDLESSNGSFIITSGDGTYAPIDPFTPHRVGHGTWIQIADRRFRVDCDGHDE